MRSHSGVISTALLLLVFALQGCGGGGSTDTSTNNSNVDTTVDTDGDGLTDYNEKTLYGTSPIKVDTDGDGISDYDEIVKYSFNSSLDNFSYNPLISDVPIIDIDIVTAPDIALNYEFTNGGTQTASTSRATSKTTAVTTESTNSNSTAIEASSTTGSELSIGVEAEISLSPSLSLSVTSTYSSSYTNSTTNEKSFSWSNAQSTENGTTLETANSIETSNSVTASSGYIATAAVVRNVGSRAFTLKNLTLSSAMYNSSGGKILAPLSNLTFDSFTGFPTVSLAGNEATGTLIFSAGNVDAPTIKSLLADSRGMKVGVATYELEDINGTPFAFARENVNASTATVIIDYETLSLPERRFLVSTVADPAVLTVTAQSVMQNILKTPYAVGTSGGLQTVNGISGDNTVTGWLVLHKTKTNAGVTVTNLYSYKSPYDFNAIKLKAGDVLHMVYQLDTDGDGLGQRMEKMLGTDVNNADTDGDGLDDGWEAFTGWVVTYPNGNQVRITSSPTLVDTDGDGWSDSKEYAQLTDPLRPDTDGDLLIDSIDPDPLTVNYSLHAQNLRGAFTNVDATTGNVNLQWEHVWSGGYTAGRDVILRQISTSPAFGTDVPSLAPTVSPMLTSVGNWLACGAVSNCWEVVGIQAVSSTDGIGTYSLDDMGLSSTNTYRYAVVSEYGDGSNYYYMHDSTASMVAIASTAKLKRVSINMMLARMSADCIDYKEWWDFNTDTFSNCEPFFDVRFNNQLIASRYSTPLQANTNHIYSDSSGTTGSLTPAYDLWTNSGNQWTDTSNPDTALWVGSTTAYIDVIETDTSVPLQITVGERDALLAEGCFDVASNNCNGADNSRTLVVNVPIQDIPVGTSATKGSTVSWSWSDGSADNYDEAGSISFSYVVSVSSLP